MVGILEIHFGHIHHQLVYDFTSLLEQQDFALECVGVLSNWCSWSAPRYLPHFWQNPLLLANLQWWPFHLCQIMSTNSLLLYIIMRIKITAPVKMIPFLLSWHQNYEYQFAVTTGRVFNNVFSVMLLWYDTKMKSPSQKLLTKVDIKIINILSIGSKNSNKGFQQCLLYNCYDTKSNSPSQKLLMNH